MNKEETGPIWIAIVLWILIGVFNYGAAKASFEAQFPTPCSQRSAHEGFAVAMGLLGPLALPCAILCSNLLEHGLMFRRKC